MVELVGCLNCPLALIIAVGPMSAQRQVEIKIVYGRNAAQRNLPCALCSLYQEFYNISDQVANYEIYLVVCDTEQAS